MANDLVFALAALIFSSAGLGMWVFSWWTRSVVVSANAFEMATIFWLGALMTAVLWRITSV